MRNKQYLGDSVYVKQYDNGILLTTENGDVLSNEIYLDSTIMYSLLGYIKHIEETESKS